MHFCEYMPYECRCRQRPHPLELQVVVSQPLWMMGTELGFSARTAGAL